ncbi:type II toxin-antitoxin system HigB family toxin [Geobacter sp.]|uniref:type II toxin-antitoxin system HigB family toxin n=1 Tax=Geobacter sp. TaxID=46610 RepID=UPI0027BA6225|nr:type II toxin-antitoxin system HigB family toxin [Geobacter sp.]
MRVVAKRTLREFWERFPDAEDALKTWYAEAEAAAWQNPAEIKSQYRSASILKDSRVVFNICGNKYRLVVKISYKNAVVLIRFIGTHREYDATDVEVV